MAERRMFAKTIIDSDLFLDMPQSTQLLYFHLSMHGDDDGFINNPKSIMRNVGCKDDDMKILKAKQFILPFESGVIVIKHWKLHNYIRSDRYSETKCIAEKEQLEVLPNHEYSMVSIGIPLVDQRLPQVRLGKVRLGKVRLGKHIDHFADRFIEFWEEYPKKIGKGAAEKSYKKINPSQELQEKIIEAVKTAKQSQQWTRDNGQFIPNPATWLNQKRWDDELQSNGGDSLNINPQMSMAQKAIEMLRSKQNE